MKKIYVAGPMRGYPAFNFPAFHEASARLRGEGWFVFSPAEADLEQDGFDNSTGSNIKSMRHYLKRDTEMLLASDAIYMLKGWENSKGATLEKLMAEYVGLNVIYEGAE